MARAISWQGMLRACVQLIAASDPLTQSNHAKDLRSHVAQRCRNRTAWKRSFFTRFTSASDSESGTRMSQPAMRPVTMSILAKAWRLESVTASDSESAWE